MQDSFSIACAGAGVIKFARRVWPAVMLAVLTACGGSGGTTTPLPEQLSISAPPRASVASATTFGSSLPADASGLTYLWDFGDGSTSTEASPAHTYAQPGDYKVSLTITDSAGANRVSTMTVTAGYFDQVKNLVCSGPDQTGWCWQQPRPSANNVSNITFVDATTAWAVGDQGQILKSIDAGATWSQQQSGTSASLGSPLFTDVNHGWIIGADATLLHTVNGGSTWEPVAAGIGNSSGYYYGAKLWSAGNDALVLNYNGMTRISRDGGQTWTASTFVPNEVSPAGRMWSWAYDGVQVSSDFGKTVTMSLPSSSTVQIAQVSVANDNLAWVAGVVSADPNAGFSPTGQQVTLWRTVDGGSTWQTVVPAGIDTSAYSWLQVNGLKMFADGSGWLSTYQGIYHTTDSGANWARVTLPADLQVLLSNFVGENGNTLQITTGSSVFRTTNAGITWNRYAITTSNGTANCSTTALKVLGNTALMNCNGLATFRSTDNGSSWVRVLGQSDVDMAVQVQSAWFFDAQHGLALNTVGSLLDTSDGGLTWTRRLMDEATTNDPLVGSLQFIDSKTGWMLRTRQSGSYGTYSILGLPSASIWRTTDGGKSWIPPQDSATFGYAATFHFVDALHGWVLADGGVKITSDGGQTWVAGGKLEQTFYSIRFFDTQTGIAVGAGGTIARTTDGGQSWQLRPSRTINQLNRVRLLDDGSGWIVGQSGTLLRTTDKGQTWQTVSLLTSKNLNDIVFSSQKTGWVLGDSGLVVRTTDGGATWAAQNSGSGVNLLTGSFVDERTGWIVGSSGTILTTVTGGR